MCVLVCAFLCDFVCVCKCVGVCVCLAVTFLRAVRHTQIEISDQNPPSNLSLSSPPPHTIFNQQKPRHQTWRTRPVPVPPLPLSLSPSQPTPFALFLDPVAIAIIRECVEVRRVVVVVHLVLFDFHLIFAAAAVKEIHPAFMQAGACAVYMNWNCYTGNSPQCIQNECLCVCVCVSISFTTYFDSLAICCRVYLEFEPKVFPDILYLPLHSSSRRVISPWQAKAVW